MSDVEEAPKKIWRETKRVEKQVLGKVGRELERVEHKIEKGVKGVLKPEMPSFPPIPKRETLSTRSPRPQAVQLEAVRKREREVMRKRRGYLSTILTRGGLGSVQTQKAKALGE